MKYIELKYTGQIDSWDRPIYVDQKNRQYVDVTLGSENPQIHCTTGGIAEPDFPINNEIVEEFSTEEFTILTK